MSAAPAVRVTALLVVLGSPASSPAAAQAPAPVGGALRIELRGATPDHGRLTALPGQRLVLRGVVRPYVPGQHAVVRLYRRGRKVSAKRVSIQKIKGLAVGRFVLSVASAAPGRLTIRASHRANSRQATMVARPLRVELLRSFASLGSRGPLVRLLQRRLAAFRYVVPRSGVFDDGTARAVMAFRKVTGMPRTTLADGAMFARLARGGGAFAPRRRAPGRRVEADLSRQVVVLIERNRVRRIYQTSSGTAATPTVVGSFRFYSKTPGTNAKGMVHSSYFIGGYAIHGYSSVPPYPASHGCLRVPVPNAAAIFSFVRLGDRIDVYR